MRTSAVVVSALLALWRLIDWALNAIGVVDTVQGLLDPSHWLYRVVFWPHLGNVMTAVGVGAVGLLWVTLRRQRASGQMTPPRVFQPDRWIDVQGHRAQREELRALVNAASEEAMAHGPVERRQELEREGVTVNGGDSQIPYAEQLVEQHRPKAKPPLKVQVVLEPNVGSGCTPGAHIRVTSEEAVTIRGAKFVVTDLLLWKDAAQQYGETTDIHQNGPFREMETNKDVLFCGEHKDLGFIRTENGRIEIQGHRDGGLEHVRTTTKGAWQLRGKVVADDGRECEVRLCFDWMNPGCPKSTPCRTPNSSGRVVSTAPAPPTPVGYR